MCRNRVEPAQLEFAGVETIELSRLNSLFVRSKNERDELAQLDCLETSLNLIFQASFRVELRHLDRKKPTPLGGFSSRVVSK